LRATRTLIVLDNCEHLVAACADLATAILRSCPDVRFLVTSREMLGLDGEAIFFVPVLSTPEGDRPPTPAEALEYDAIRLFVARTRLRNQGFELDPDNVASIAALCRQLEGIPLAIELAAARTGVLGVSQILARMSDRFRLLTSANRTKHTRRHTLRATIEWSHDLLSDEERVLLRRLSVFVGGWTLDAAESVMRGAPSLPLGVSVSGGVATASGTVPSRPTPHSPLPTLDILERLVDKSLVIAEEHHGAARYRMLETICGFAREKLAEAAEEETFFERHGEWFLRLAELGRWSVTNPGENDQWLGALEADYGNVLAVLRRALNDGHRPDFVARLLEDLGGFWETRSRYGEGLMWLERGIEARDATPEHTENILTWAGTFAFRLDKLDLARSYWQRGLAQARAGGRQEIVATVLANLAMVFDSLGDRDRAEAHTAEALEISRSVGDRTRIASHVLNLGTIVSNRGDQARAIELMEEALEIGRELNYTRLVAATLINLAHAAGRQDAWKRSEELAEEALSVATEVEDAFMAAAAKYHLGAAATMRGEYAHAESLAVSALKEFCSLSSHHFVPSLLEELARIAERRGAIPRALTLLGAASALRRELPVLLAPADEAHIAHLLADTRGTLPPAEADSLLAEGGAMTLDKAIQYAVSGGPEGQYRADS
jgi:predicted ATPase